MRGRQRSDREQSVYSHLRHRTDHKVASLVHQVWDRKDEFICWPSHPLLLMPGCTRDVRFHLYEPHLIAKLRAAHIAIDRRSNGPAIMAYKLAGGQRPMREGGTREWHVHHIYDGKFPAPGRTSSIRAAKRGEHFTEAAGLVAVHPIADALADEVPYFAWLLRGEAYSRFRYDPDGVFGGGGERSA